MVDILIREQAIDQDREHLWTVGLANNNCIDYIELVSLGSKTRAVAEPMEIFNWALQKRSPKIIMVHNHPSGELSASKLDKI